MAKAVAGLIKLQIPAGRATPAPPVGPALGQRGLKIKEFCDSFNNQTKHLEPGVPLPVVITAYSDRSFIFVVRTPPVSYFLRKAARVDKGAAAPGQGSIGSVTSDQIRDIARQKMADLNVNDQDLEAATRMIVGSARSMGIQVVG